MAKYGSTNNVPYELRELFSLTTMSEVERKLLHSKCPNRDRTIFLLGYKVAMKRVRQTVIFLYPSTSSCILINQMSQTDFC